MSSEHQQIGGVAARTELSLRTIRHDEETGLVIPSARSQGAAPGSEVFASRYLHRARSDSARLTAAVYRTSLGIHAPTAPAVRRQVLALDAARADASALREELTCRIPEGDWTPVWATGSGFTPALRDTLTGHADAVTAVACTDSDGGPVAVTGDAEGAVRVWDLRTGTVGGGPRVGHTGVVSALTCTDVGGTPVMVTCGGAAWVWDLRTGTAMGEPLAGHPDGVLAVGCVEVDGFPVAVTCGRDGALRVWDLRTGAMIGRKRFGHSEGVSAVTCRVVDGVPVAVTGGGRLDGRGAGVGSADRDGHRRAADRSYGWRLGRGLHARGRHPGCRDGRTSGRWGPGVGSAHRPGPRGAAAGPHRRCVGARVHVRGRHPRRCHRQQRRRSADVGPADRDGRR
ncbi:hypothetical protein E2651_05250 [Streptomyces sp. MZ04]|nr:hypothetical protein E2651_05250 [Streptomyces sp. MZ04]